MLFISPDDYVPVKPDPRPAVNPEPARPDGTPLYPLVFIGPTPSGR